MSSIKDIEYAMKGEQTPSLKVEQEYIPETIQPKSTTPKTDEFFIFKLVNSNRGGGVYIPGIDHVIDPRTITDKNPEGNGPEMIRLLTGVTTIWVKEQKDVSADYVKKNTRTIEFPKGTKFISVPAWDKALLDFMEMCRHNIRNPHRKSGSKFEFFKYDPNEVAKARYEREVLELNMITKANSQPIEKMKKHSVYLGINLIDEIGRPKPEERVRTEYMLEAKRDPERFKNSLDSKEIDIQYMIRAAILDSKIDITRGDHKAYWGQGGGLITPMSKTEQPLQFLTNFALMPTDESKDFLKQLKAIST